MTEKLPNVHFFSLHRAKNSGEISILFQKNDELIEKNNFAERRIKNK